MFLSIPLLSIGQDQGNIWYFGHSAGLDFNQGEPVALQNGQTYFTGCPMTCHGEGTAVLSDSNGELLLYSNGEKIWNRFHQVMPNGDDLLGGASSTQSSLILPLPGSNHYFYVFTTDDFHNGNLTNGFRYSLVDICRNDGLGAVLENEKNIPLVDMTAEKITAVKHANGIDYWVITHGYFSNSFYAFHLSAVGISDPVISNIGSVHPTGLQNNGGAIGQMKASPNGEKIAIVNGNCSDCIAEYFDFDSGTGVVSNPVNIHYNDFFHHYGVSFSPDNSKLYLASILNGNGIYQYDLQAGNGNPDSVKLSRTLISNIAPFSPNFSGLQLAPDGKIYATYSPINSGSSIGVINFPDSSGLSCEYVHNAIDVSTGITSYGLSSFMDSYQYGNGIPNCLITSSPEYTQRSELLIFPNPVSNQASISIPDGIDSGIIKITNSLGQSVRNIAVNGANQVNFHRNNLTAGIYYLQLIKNNSVLDSRKLVIAD